MGLVFGVSPAPKMSLLDLNDTIRRGRYYDGGGISMKGEGLGFVKGDQRIPSFVKEEELGDWR